VDRQTRREFLARSAAAGGLLALRTGDWASGWAAEADQPVDMAIARWTGPIEPTPGSLQQIAAKLTQQAIAGLGGLRRFVTKGSVVWVKPNIGWDRTPELAANTNPDVVATLVRLCFEAGAKTVKVGDNTCNPAQKAYETSGIAAAVKPLGAEVVFLDRSRFREAEIGGERLKTIPIYPAIVDCDLVINVPVVKHHVLATLTMCMKNYMGVIEKRASLHQDMATSLCDLTRYMKPRISVLDAVRVLTAHGPTGGNPADVQVKTTVAAGVDIVALDAFGAEIMGKAPRDVASILKAEQVGLGKADYRSLVLREFSVS
jgi:uncharacterized protein (DUF362 family)